MLNFFANRSTNVADESLNAKIKVKANSFNTCAIGSNFSARHGVR